MPRGVYERKKRAGAPAVVKTARKGGGDSEAVDLLTKLRAARTKAEDRVVAYGTAIEALEALDER